MESILPKSFPLLPDIPFGHERWSPNVLEGHRTLRNLYRHAWDLTTQEDVDPLRVAFHVDALTSDGIPILIALDDSEDSDETPLPEAWIFEAAKLFGDMVAVLRHVGELAKGKEDAHIVLPTLVQPTIRTGKRGRPPKGINLAFVTEATRNGRHIKLTELADILGCHRVTLWRYLKKYGLSREYSTLSNHDLDTLVKSFKRDKPESGLRYLIGFLRTRGIRIQKRRVLYSLRRVDNLGRVLRHRKIITRRVYHVKRPNALWHLDGHHKMIRWGIVFHGFADGYCRTVAGLRASNNNRANTVLGVFLEAALEYGFPSRLRGDRGGENIECAIYMVMRNGPNRSSFMWGSSTRNTRIERLWVEVGSQFVRRWRGFFSRLERLHQLDVDKPEHLWLLHTLFLDAINADCIEFQTNWNAHPMAGHETFNKSSNDIRLLGQAQLGVYRDDCEGLHPDTINKYYGVLGAERVGQPGAGNPPDEDAEHPSLAEHIGVDQGPQVRHEAIDVPDHRNPFSNDSEAENKFYRVLSEVVKQKITPAGYGLLPEEWDADGYPDVEILRAGRQMKTEIQVSLAHPIWAQRAEFWVQGLNVLSHFNFS